MIVRESISNFVRGKGPKETLGLGSRVQIHQWFADLGIDRSHYEIGDDLSIHFWKCLQLVRSPITELPENLNIHGYLDLMGCPIAKLPKGLKIEAWLDIRDTPIKSLPPDLKVGGDIMKDF